MIDETLKLARRGLAPSDAERARLRASLSASLNAGGGASAPASVRGWAALKASGKSGLALGTALLGAGFLAGVLFDGARHTEAPSVLAPPAVLAPAAAPSSTPPEPRREPALPLPVEPQPAPAPKQRARASTARSSAAFAHELALVQRAERAIRNGDPALALALLAELDHDHPRAALGEERAAARVMARCQAKEPTAPLEAERFLTDVAGSVYADRVRSLCGLTSRR
jgi:hypothetical protein